METKNSLVSVVVPVYKVEKYLTACIESILNQCYQNLELILVDDGSPDGCGAICDSYAEKDNRVKVIHKKNGGVSAARNSGLSLATGKYLTFCDSDDSYEPDWIRQLVSAMEDNNADAVVGNHKKVLEDGTTVSQSQNEIGIQTTADPKAKLDYIFRYLFGYRHCWEIWARLFRMDLIREKNIRFCETCGNFAEDLGFTMEYALHANKTVSVSNAGYRYLLREGSMMRNSAGIPKVDAVNEVALHFARAYRTAFDKEDTLHALPVLHFLLMYDQYQVLLSQDKMQELGKHMETVRNQQAWLSLTKALPSCYGTMKRYFGVYNARRILMLSHYTRHRSWIRYDLERRIFYKLNKPKS